MNRLLAPLTLVCTLMMTAGCSNPAPGAAIAASAEDLAGTRWTLVAWSGKPDSALLRAIELNFEDGSIAGEGPCNLYNAAFKLDGDDGTFTLGPIGATKRGCEPERGQLEQDWFAALASLERLQLDGDRLALTSSSGLRLDFARAASVPAGS